MVNDVPLSLLNLKELLEKKVEIFQKTVSKEEQKAEAKPEAIFSKLGCLQKYIVQSREFSIHFRDLNRETEQEVIRVGQRLRELRKQQEQLGCELKDLDRQLSETVTQLQRNHSIELVRVQQLTEEAIARKEVQVLHLKEQEEDLTALQAMLGEDVQRYEEEANHLQNFSDKLSSEMEGDSQSRPEKSVGTVGKETRRATENGVSVQQQADSHSLHQNQMEKGLPSHSVTGHSSTQNGDSVVSSKSPGGKQTESITREAPSSAELHTKMASTNRSASFKKETNLKRSGSVKDLIYKFSGSENGKTSPTVTGDHKTERKSLEKSGSDSELMVEEKRKPGGINSLFSKSDGGTLSDQRKTSNNESVLPTISVIPAPAISVSEQNTYQHNGSRSLENLSGSNFSGQSNPAPDTSQNRGSLLTGSTEIPLASEPSGKVLDSDKQPENFPTNTRASQSAKYQLLQDSEVSLNHLKGTDGRVAENGRDSHWENNGTSPYLGLTYSIDRQSSRLDSLDSTGSRDWDSISDRMSGIDSPSRVFNSPYKTPSLDYDRINRISEYKSMPVLSPATSEISLFNSRSSSPVPSPTMLSPRSRFTAYDTWNKQRAVMTSLPALRPGVHNKRDYIEELTRLLDNCQKRNQFLEAESVEMNKERNQIRFEMRGLLVSNEDMLRTNTQLQGELKRVMDRVVELERENTMLNDRFAHMESELSQAREVMVEANAQEYAFNYLQQSLKNKIQDAEENMEKQNQQTQDLSEKLWLTERKMEELETEKQNQDKIIVDLRNKVLRLETELGEALQISTQSTAELNLFQKLKNDSQQRVADLEENLLQRTQELQKAQMIVNRLQGEVSGKLIDKERSLEEEIQLRERLQLQCKQAERSLEDLQMEVQTAVQAKEDIAKHLKLAQEKMIELESDLEEMHDNEQRWAVKNKRAQEQMDQLQLKLIQERDLREQLDCEKVMLERQIRDLRVEVHELQNSKVQEDVMSRAELRVKELENSLRTEERNKIILTNNIGKLERKIKELTDQVEEEHRLAEEQKDLMTQRMRTLKRQLNEAEEEMSRKETQFRLSQRELSEEREAISRLQRQLLDQQVQIKRNESLKMRQALDNFRLDLDSQDEEEGSSKQQPTHFI
ncbi:myosin-11 isoform X2 [Amia ocellicauda]